MATKKAPAPPPENEKKLVLTYVEPVLEDVTIATEDGTEIGQLLVFSDDGWSLLLERLGKYQLDEIDEPTPTLFGVSVEDRPLTAVEAKGVIDAVAGDLAKAVDDVAGVLAGSPETALFRELAERCISGLIDKSHSSPADTVIQAILEALVVYAALQSED